MALISTFSLPFLPPAAEAGRQQNYIGRIETGQRRVDLIEFVIICRACGADGATETASLVKKIGEVLPRRRKNI